MRIERSLFLKTNTLIQKKMKKNYLLLILVFAGLSLSAQDTWTAKTDVANGWIPRGQAVAFSIGTTGYVGTGCNGSGVPVFHKYYSQSDVWTQIASLDNRYEAVAFSIGNKGYCGTGEGAGGSVILKSFYEYDTTANTWTQKADFGGTARYGAVGFSIGSKGYIGTGADMVTGNTKDFWEYNPATNVWTRKADFGGSGRKDAVGFSIGSKGYIGTGNTGSDFWEYNPSTDTWTAKASYGGGAIQEAVGFSIGTKGFIATGYPSNSYLYSWDQATNVWTRKADVPGAPVRNAIGFSIGSKGYVGTGDAGNGTSSTNYSTFYEYASGIFIGINELEKPTQFTISPVPFNSQTTINFEEEQLNINIKIIDELGKEVKSIDFSGKQLILQREDMKPGIYFVQIISENKYVTNKKIVIE